MHYNVWVCVSACLVLIYNICIIISFNLSTFGETIWLGAYGQTSHYYLPDLIHCTASAAETTGGLRFRGCVISLA